jgi:hypothetical protein
MKMSEYINNQSKRKEALKRDSATIWDNKSVMVGV